MDKVQTPSTGDTVEEQIIVRQPRLCFNKIVKSPTIMLFPGCTKAYYTSPALLRITFIFQLTVFFSTTILVASKDTTTVPLGKAASLAPGLVSPLHITLAPLKRNLIAPLSTCC